MEMYNFNFGNYDTEILNTSGVFGVAQKKNSNTLWHRLT